MRELVNTVLRHHREADNGSTAADLNSSYDDLYDHVLRVAEWTESLRDMITTIFETNLSLQDARLNTVMKKLTAWAAIIAVPTAITGYFGQNLLYPGIDTQWGFVLSTAIIVIIAGGLYLQFHRKGWL
jgi:magnesium transporter